MKHIYILDFGSYYAYMNCDLIYERIGKSAVVKIRRQWGDLPFIEYFKYALFSRLANYFNLRANAIEYQIRVTAGMEKDVVWRKRKDGKYHPYDTFADMEMPYLARTIPPTQKKVKGIYVTDTGKPKIAGDT